MARVNDAFMWLLLRADDAAFKPERKFLVLRMVCGCGANRRLALRVPGMGMNTSQEAK